METLVESTIATIEKLRLTHLEAQIVGELAMRTGVDPAKALDMWYRSNLSLALERNEYGLQYLDAGYLVDELLRDDR